MLHHLERLASSISSHLQSPVQIRLAASKTMSFHGAIG